MVERKMYQRIQDLKRQGYGKIAISRELKVDPATVRKYFHMRPKEYQQYQREVLQREKIFDKLEGEILEIYRENNNQRLNMSAVYDYLEEKLKTFPGGEKSLRNYIHYLEASGELKYSDKIRVYKKVPELPYGKQMQLDFGEYLTRSRIKLYIFAILLSASRYKYISFQDKPFKTIDVILHLLDAFDYFRGYAEELVIDQDSLMVANENYGEIIFTKKFEDFIKEMGIKMYVCRKADPESKGKIENLVKYVKYNFLSVRDFESVEEAKESLRKWLNRRANGKISQATKKVPAIAIEEERIYLKPIKNSIFRKGAHLGREERVVSEKGFIMIEGKEYSVPIEYRLKGVEFYKTEREIYIFNKRSGEEIAKYVTLKGTAKRARRSEHFRYKSFNLKEIETKVFSMFDDEGWKEFVYQTKKAYPRYCRDQYTLALKVFSSLEDPGIFQMALDYCLDNKTFGMKVLYDTYKHYLKEHKEEQEIIFNAFKGITSLEDIPEVEVSKRSVDEYAALVKKGGVK